MTVSDSITRRFYQILPSMRSWMSELLIDHADRAAALDNQNFTRLPRYFSNARLAKTRIVVVPRVPFPPLAAMGLPELAVFEKLPLAGITFNDTFFVQTGHFSESLCFHELVHVIQWETLGIDDFLITYGVGLLRYGYERHPFEQMANEMQAGFDRDQPQPDLTTTIINETRGIYRSLVMGD